MVHFMDSRMDDRAPRIDPTFRRGRKLIDVTFRAIAKWRPACEWGLLSFNRTALVASVASATYQTAPQPTSVSLMTGGASRQPPRARHAPRRREGLIGQISGRLCIRRPKDFAASGC